MNKNDYLDFLKADRRAGSATFWNKLRKIGLSIDYAGFGIWNDEPCVEIGNRKIFLTEVYETERNHYSMRYRMQNDVVQEIREAISELKKADQDVEDFFDSIEK